MDEKTAGKVNSFIGRLKENFNVSIDRVIVFGSRARGDHLKKSDLDLIIVSEDFKDVEWTERGKEFYRYWGADYPVEILCYTPEELEMKKQQIGTVQTAVKEGKEVEV